MQTVVSAHEMRWCDETAIRSFGVPGLLLMDRAGTGASHVLLTRYAPLTDRAVTVVCGSGNNAGDGFVVARVLAHHGAHVQVVLCVPPARLKGDAAAQFRMLRREERTNVDRLKIVALRSAMTSDSPQPALVVDAVFGTGFTGRPSGAHARAIEWMNRLHAPIASLDVPSGVDATTGLARGVAVRSALTITFGMLKTGLLLNAGRPSAGHVVCIDIGIPRAITGDRRLATRLIERGDVRLELPARPHHVHKYSAGKVLVIAGSRGYTGAATLTTMSALRSGAGAVVLAYPDAVHAVLAKKLTEPILLPVPSDSNGGYASQPSKELIDRLAWADVLLIGPGIGRSPETAQFVQAVFDVYRGPAVIDADALHVLPSVGLTRNKRRDWIVTPHSGEFSPLVGLPPSSIEEDRVEVTRAFARRTAWTTVLKGSPTCTAEANGTVTINSTGNPGMATVGSGDVLAGLVAGFRAQGMTSAAAAWSGVYIHGRGGDLARERLGERSLLAGDILDSIPHAVHEMEMRG